MFRIHYEAQLKMTNSSIAIKKNYKSALMKIITNYSQTIFILNVIKIDWGKLFNNLFQAPRLLSGNVQDIIALECVFEGNFLIFEFI